MRLSKTDVSKTHGIPPHSLNPNSLADPKSPSRVVDAPIAATPSVEAPLVAPALRPIFTVAAAGERLLLKIPQGVSIDGVTTQALAQALDIQDWGRVQEAMTDRNVYASELEIGSRVAKAFRPADLPDIFWMLFHGPYPHRVDARLEFLRNCQTFKRMWADYANLRQKKFNFLLFTDQSTDFSIPENVTFNYFPGLPTSEVKANVAVMDVVDDFAHYVDWAPNYLSSVLLSKSDSVARGRAEIYVPFPLTNRYFTNDFQFYSKGRCRLQYFRQDSTKPTNMAYNYGDFYTFPTADGGTLFLRRGVIDAENLPDGIGTDAAREGIIANASALLKRWKSLVTGGTPWVRTNKKGAEDSYGEEAYTLGTVYTWDGTQITIE